MPVPVPRLAFLFPFCFSAFTHAPPFTVSSQHQHPLYPSLPRDAPCPWVSRVLSVTCEPGGDAAWRAAGVDWI
ncbi:hypothetical protein C8R43DRAFT_1031912, partial [Mycena crocata]